MNRSTCVCAYGLLEAAVVVVASVVPADASQRETKVDTENQILRNVLRNF